MPVTWRSRLRLLVGMAISVAFLAVLLTRVDVGGAVREITRADPVLLIGALALVWVELAIRAQRWRWLLIPHAAVTYPASISYLCIGYFANSMLPARLGDVVRAYLAGRSFGISRLTALGTIMVERIGDGLWMVATALATTATVLAATTLQASAFWLLVAVAVAAAVAGAAWWAFRRPGLRATRIGRLVGEIGGKLLRGGLALRSPSGALLFVGSTAVSWVAAVGVLSATTRAVGVELSVIEAALATSGVALSLSIPAGPNALGTYELVGTAILVGLGVPPESALAAIALTHVIVSVPPSLAGLVMTWRLHIRIGDVARGEDEDARPSEPAP